MKSSRLSFSKTFIFISSWKANLAQRSAFEILILGPVGSVTDSRTSSELTLGCLSRLLSA